MKHGVAALALYTAVCSGQAADARQAAAMAATGDIVRIPFQPPIGRPLSYTTTVTRKRGNVMTVTKMRQTLTFRTEGPAFVLTITCRSVEQDGRTFDLADAGTLATVPAVLRPLVASASYDLDDSGAFIRVRNWSALRKSFAALPAAAAAMVPPADRERFLAVSNRVFQPMMAMSAEDAPAMLLKGWPQFMGSGGFEGGNGAVYEDNVETANPLFPIPIPSVVRISVTRQPGGTLRAVTQSQPDRAAMTKALTDFMAKIRPGVAPARLGKFDEAVEMMRTIDMQDRLDVTLDCASGVVRTAVHERKASAEGTTETEMVERVEVALTD